MSYQPYPTALGCQQAAEALGRAYASSIGKPWPMPPDVYGPGRQPQPPSAYYQMYWQAPQAPQPATDPVTGQTQAVMPQRIEVDATAQALAGQQVTITGGTVVTLAFAGLVADPVVVTGQVAESLG